jgi:lysozyme
MTRRVNAETVDLIKRWEGFRGDAYLCPAGKWTIGYGHTDTARGYRDRREIITEEQAEVLLREDLARFERAISRIVTVPLSDGQYGALVSWAFNVGAGAAERSTLVRLLNAGDYEAVPRELARWNRVGGAVSQGLANRRAAEAGLWARGGFVAGRGAAVQAPEEVTTIRDAAATDTGRGAGVMAIVAAVGGVLPQTAPVIEALGNLAPLVTVALIAAALIGVLIWRRGRA